jgi:hypothetical protein
MKPEVHPMDLDMMSYALSSKLQERYNTYQRYVDKYLSRCNSLLVVTVPDKRNF